MGEEGRSLYTLRPMALLPLALTLLAVLHPGSISGSRISVDGSAVQHRLRFQALTLVEELPVDTNGDLLLDEAEFAAAKGRIETYLLDHYRIFEGGLGGTRLPGEVAELKLFLDGPPELPLSHWLEASLVYGAGAEVERLGVEELLFEESNPLHVEYLSVTFGEEIEQHHIFHPGDQDHDFESSGEFPDSRLASFFKLGMDHILEGYDHLLFLAALLVAVRGLRSLAWVVTAFTLAHSVTLALAALELVELPGRFVELAIALSIVYVAAENLIGVERRSVWVEAFLFGLLHGLGFAGFLGDALRWEEELVVPLLGFNLGVEAGQLLAVVPVALVLAGARRVINKGDETEGPELLVPRLLGRIISAGIVVVGLYWFAERAGFIG